MDKKREYQEFLSRIVCLTLLKTFIVETFSVSLFWAKEKIHTFEVFVTIFRRKVFASQNQIIS